MVFTAPQRSSGQRKEPAAGVLSVIANYKILFVTLNPENIADLVAHVKSVK